MLTLKMCLENQTGINHPSTMMNDVAPNLLDEDDIIRGGKQVIKLYHESWISCIQIVCNPDTIVHLQLCQL